MAKRKTPSEYLKELQQIAKKRGGKCLANSYLGTHIKIKWQCKERHQWEASPINIKGNKSKKGTWCPYCSGRKVDISNSLLSKYPNIAKEWHPTLNNKLTPNSVTPKSHEKVWWLCRKGDIWKAIVADRTRGRGCPYCKGQRVNKKNCLYVVNPELAKEWHPTKNINITPKDVRPYSNEKVWWKCKRRHEWQATVAGRTNGRGCPNCNNYKTSGLELRIFSEMKYLFKDSLHRSKIDDVECDIYIPRIKVAIELDGGYWHKEKYKSDKQKSNFLEKKGVKLIRVRADSLRKISNNDVKYNERKIITFNIMENVVSKIIKISKLKIKDNRKLLKYLDYRKFKNEKLHLSLQKRLPFPLPGYSLSELNPKLAKEWHPTENSDLRPNEKSAFSHTKVWWLCINGHEWRASIANRMNGRNCPFCSNRKINLENCLSKTHPKLAREWHTKKNGILSADDISAGSSIKVWWQCINNSSHSWQQSPAIRKKDIGCPYCRGLYASEENNLQAVNPKLAREWHPTKNKELKPKNFTPNSNKKVWWLCKKGHEWRAAINNRNTGRNCPYCYGRYATKVNCLQAVNPKLAKEWHPYKNKRLTPKDVKPYSNIKVWWKCKKRHEWRAVIASRSDGRCCPKCAREARKKK